MTTDDRTKTPADERMLDALQGARDAKAISDLAAMGYPVNPPCSCGVDADGSDDCAKEALRAPFHCRIDGTAGTHPRYRESCACYLTQPPGGGLMVGCDRDGLGATAYCRLTGYPDAPLDALVERARELSQAAADASPSPEGYTQMPGELFGIVGDGKGGTMLARAMAKHESDRRCAMCGCLDAPDASAFKGIYPCASCGADVCGRCALTDPDAAHIRVCDAATCVPSIHTHANGGGIAVDSIHLTTPMDVWPLCSDYEDTSHIIVEEWHEVEEDFVAWLAKAVAQKPGVCGGCIRHIGDYIEGQYVRPKALADRRYDELMQALRVVADAVIR